MFLYDFLTTVEQFCVETMVPTGRCVGLIVGIPLGESDIGECVGDTEVKKMFNNQPT